MKILITLLGWLAWTIIMLRIDKDQYDESGTSFPLKEYALKNWDNWLASLIGAAVLLTIGQQGLHIINITETTSSLTWNDAYYAGSGFFTESVIYGIKKWRKKKSNE